MDKSKQINKPDGSCFISYNQETKNYLFSLFTGEKSFDYVIDRHYKPANTDPKTIVVIKIMDENKPFKMINGGKELFSYIVNPIVLKPVTWLQCKPNQKVNKLIELTFENLLLYIDKLPLKEQTKADWKICCYEHIYEYLQTDEKQNLTWGVCTQWQLNKFINHFNTYSKKSFFQNLDVLFDNNPKELLPKISKSIEKMDKVQFYAKHGMGSPLTHFQQTMYDFLKLKKDHLHLIKIDETTPLMTKTPLITNLNTNQLKKLFNQLKATENGFIDPDTKEYNFLYVFGQPLPDEKGFEPIRWIKKAKNKWVNKASLIELCVLLNEKTIPDTRFLKQINYYFATVKENNIILKPHNISKSHYSSILKNLVESL